MTDKYGSFEASYTGSTVTPLDEAGQPIPGGPAKPRRRRRGWLVFGGVALAVIAVGAAGALFWFNTVIRGPLGAAEVIPADADIVLTIDAFELIEGDRVNRLLDAFAPAGVDINIGEALEEFDDELESEFGVRFFDELTGWLGRSAAVALWVPEDAILGAEADEVDFVVSVMTRDEGSAQTFLDGIVDQAGDKGESVETVSLAGVDVYKVSGSVPTLYATVDSGRLLFASDSDRMIAVLDPTDVITDQSTFNRLWAAVGGEQAFATGYVSQGFVGRLSDLIATQGGIDPAQVAAGAFMGTMTLDDDGVAFAAASIALDGSTALGGTWGRELPEDAYGYISLAIDESLDLGETAAEQAEQLGSLGAGDDGFGFGPADGFVDEINDLVGFDVFNVLSQLHDEVLFAAIPSESGALSALTGVPIGIGFAIGVRDEGPVLDALDALPELFGPEGSRLVPAGDGLWSVDVGDGVLVQYGVVDGRFVVSSDLASLDAVTAGPGGITDSESWQRMSALVGDDMMLFVDVTRIVDSLAPDSPDADMFEPVRAFGMGQSVRDGIAIVNLRVIIDY